MSVMLSRRALFGTTGALVVGFALPAPGRAADTPLPAFPKRVLDPKQVDAFLAIDAEGGVTIYCGKVDLGTGMRIAIPQIVAEELGIPLARIRLIEGDTALTPDQGPTAGSTGIARGGMQIRQAAATARAALVRLAAAKLGLPAEELAVADGAIGRKGGGVSIGFGALVPSGSLDLAVDPKAATRAPDSYTVVGRTLPRPDVPAKVTGRHGYVHDFTLPGMLHGRAIRPPRQDAVLASVDEGSIAHVPGARIVRLNSFLGVVAAREWDAVKAARDLKASWTGGGGLIGSDAVAHAMRSDPSATAETLTKRGDAAPGLAAGDVVKASFYWPVQTHGSIGPSCAVADVTAATATIWTASQATHKFRPTFAAMLGLPLDKVRLIYLDGAGCYGMNGHDDAAADAALLSKATGKPVRVQWMRADEHGWDPKGPPQLLDIAATLGPDGRIAAWRTDMWLPKATANLASVPLIAPIAAGLAQQPGLSTGLIFQNGSPSYKADAVEVVVHWLKTAPLRPSNIRAPGKVANVFAVESMADMLAHRAKVDPLDFRMTGLTNPRGIEVMKRVAAMMKWETRVGIRGDGQGRGVAYVHYKDDENYVAMAMDVAVDRKTGAVAVRRVACAHDCGQMINPDAVRAQVEGCILQTLSRALFEEIAFDHDRVTSTDWASYPILRFPDVPVLEISLVERQNEPPLGAGESATAPVAAALANAIFDATGVRLTTAPFTPRRLLDGLARQG